MALIGTNVTSIVHSTATNTTPVGGGGKGFSVGQIHTDEKTGKVYRYVQCNSAVTQYDVVHIDAITGVAAGLTTALSAAATQIGIAAATFASGDYGWVQIYGRTSIKCLGSCAKSVSLFSTTTAGNLDDATASNYLIMGAVLATTNPSATASAMDGFITYPFVYIRPGVL